MPVTYTFANATSAIPLSQLDNNFATPITIGNVVAQLGNTVSTIGNVTLANVTITSGTANGVTQNNSTFGNVTILGGTTNGLTQSNSTLSNVTISSVSTPLTYAEGGTGSSSAFTANGVVYASSTSALATGSNLVWTGTNFGIGTSSPSSRLEVSNAGTNTIKFTNSSASISTYLGANSSNSYIGTPSNVALAFTTNDTEQMRINSAGSVSIGTTANSGKLTISAPYSYSGQNVGISLPGNSGDAYSFIANIAGANCLSSGASYYGGGSWLLDSNSTTFSSLEIAAGGFYWYNGTGTAGTTTTGNTRMTLDSSGNLTVNTGSLNSTAWYGVNSSSIISSGSGSWPLLFGINGSEKMRLDSSGNLGLGVTPSAWSENKALQVNARTSLYSSTDGGAVVGNNLYYNGTNNIYIASSYATAYQQNNLGQHIWYTAASGTAGNAISFTQAMTLDNSGRLLVGQTSSYGGTPGASILQVTSGSGGAQAATFTTAAGSIYTPAVMWNQASTGYLAYFLYGGSNGTNCGSISYNGTSTVYSTTSDKRLKENIVDANSGLAKLSNVKIRSFDWIHNKNNVDFGVIAQELIEVAPEAVTIGVDNPDGTIDKPWGVDTSALVPAMIKAIQELNAEIQQLKAEVATLKGA
jgi:Chaperone of endosialidase